MCVYENSAEIVSESKWDNIPGKIEFYVYDMWLYLFKLLKSKIIKNYSSIW